MKIGIQEEHGSRALQLFPAKNAHMWIIIFKKEHSSFNKELFDHKADMLLNYLLRGKLL